MKKLMPAVCLLLLSVSGAFSQGYVTYAPGIGNHMYDVGGVADANVDVALFWAAASTTPDVDSFYTSTPISGGSLTPTAWTDINDGQFTLAVDAANSTSVIATTSASGTFTYNGGTSFGIAGTTAGVTYTFYCVSWNSAYSTPTAAAAAGSAVGWSDPFQYTTTTSIGTPGSMKTAGLNSFSLVPVPEPTTLALGALGGASLLLFRRRKQTA